MIFVLPGLHWGAVQAGYLLPQSRALLQRGPINLQLKFFHIAGKRHREGCFGRENICIVLIQTSQDVG